MTGFFGFSSNCGEPEDFPDDDATGEAMKVTRMKFFPDGHVEELITETTAPAPDAPAAREDAQLLLMFANVICPKLRDVLVPYGALAANWDDVANQLRRIAASLTSVPVEP